MIGRYRHLDSAVQVDDGVRLAEVVMVDRWRSLLI